MEEIILVITSLLGVIGLIFLTYFAGKWLNRRMYSVTGKTVRVLERENLGQDKCVVIVKAGSKYMLLGVTQHHIDKLCDLDENDISEQLKAPPAPAGGKSFLENLKIAAKQSPYVKPFVKDKEQNDDK